MKNKLLLINLSILSLLTSCGNVKVVEKQFFSFSTLFELKAYNTEEENLYKIEALINKYSKLFDGFNSYSNINNIYTINNTNEEVVIDEKLYEALKFADEYYFKSEKYFNPYIGELTFSYKEAFKNNKLPEKKEIESALINLKDFNLEFNDLNKSVKRNGNSKIDLGAFAKGYTLNKVNELVNELNIKHYFINAGSSSSYFSSKPNDEPFKASLRYFTNKGIKVKNTSVGISSIFEQYVEINNKIYSHIINPFTGESKVYYDFSIVETKDSMISDVFSTVLMLLDDKKMIEKFSQEFNFSYVLFKDDKEIYSSNDIEIINL